MEPIIDRFESFSTALEKSENFDDVLTVCWAIDNLSADSFAKHFNDDDLYAKLIPVAEVLVKQLCKSFKANKDLSFHLKIIKSIMKPALCMNYINVELLLDNYGSKTSTLGAECLRIHGWLQNLGFIKKGGISLPGNLQIHESFVSASTMYSSDTRFFRLAIGNYILAYDNKIVTKNKSFLFTVVLTNLENSHHNVHKLLLDLFKRLLKCYSKDNYEDQKMIGDVIELPWTNRNKYPLMASLISINHNLLLSHSTFNMSSFLQGMQVALKIHPLLAPSQSLAKTVQSNAVFKFIFIETISKLFWSAENEVVLNLVKYWYNSFDVTTMDLLYKAIGENKKLENIPTTSASFYRLLMLRNVMRKQFKDSELDSRIKEFCCDIEELPMKVEIFHILMNFATNEQEPQSQLENILTLLSFLRFNLSIAESYFIEHHVMRLLPNLFNLLVLRKMRIAVVLKEIFGIIESDLYLHGIDLGTYESTIFSLKLLQIMLKLYCGETVSRSTKNANIEGNVIFGKYLKENEIWDITSDSIFKQLLSLVKHEDSDISDLAVNILVDHFIKKSGGELNVKIDGTELFADWIDKKVCDEFESNDVASGSVAKRYFILKYELLRTKGSAAHELMCTIDHLKNLFSKLKNDADPFKSMQDGLNLFKIMDCINYALSQSEVSEVKPELIAVLNVLLKLVAFHFLDLISNEPPSFEILDEKLVKLIENSSLQGYDPSEVKSKLLFYIWFTLRSSSELSENLATIVNRLSKPDERQFAQVKVMTTCLDVNIQILIRCCHKGVIDSASRALGKVATIISKEYSKLCDKTTGAGKNLHSLLIKMKREINCGERQRNEIEDIRCSRGLMVMSYRMISSHPGFLRFLMDSLIVTREIHSFEDTKSIRFVDNIKPIQLHLLAFLIRDGDLAEEMLKYYNVILLATFKAYKESKDFVVVNGLLQVIGAIDPKISKQKSGFGDPDDESTVTFYEPKAVTVYEFYVKMTCPFRIALFDLTMNRESLSLTYIITLLHIFSNFEYRNNGEHWTEIENMRDIFQNMMSHKCEKIRILAGRCFANWHKTDDKMLKVIKKRVSLITSYDGNVVHATVHCLRYMIQRYENCLKHCGSFNSDEFMASLRKKVTDCFNQDGFKGATNFFLRLHMLDFLMFLGFKFEDKVVQSLMIENGLTSHFGYKLWMEKIKNLQIKSIKMSKSNEMK